MLSRFVLVAEVIEANGDRATWTMVDEDAKPWDTLGLLEHARCVEAACYQRPED